MQTLKKFYFGKQKAKVNTYIGGIGGTINTPALLAAKLGISESRIKLFKVTGVDLECAIVGTVQYTPQTYAFFNDTSITYFIDKDKLCGYLNQVNSSFSGNTNMHTFEAEGVRQVLGTYYFIGTPLVTRLIFPLLTDLGIYCMNGRNTHTLLYIPLCTRIGDSVSTSQGAISNLASSSKIYVHPSLLTINGGNPHFEIQSLITKGCYVAGVTNFTPPNPVTNLSTGTIYNTAVQLNFTLPTSLNGVDFYECYANGKLMNEIKSSGEFITELTPSTNYNIRIVAVDMFYNRSELSNNVNMSTNTIDFDPYNYINASGNQAHETAIVNLFTDLKTQGLYAKIQAFYPFLGTTSTQHKWNAKNPLDTNAAFRLQFFGGGTHSNLGYQCNGTNSYANTFFVPSANTSVENSGITLVSGTNNPAPNNNTLDFGSEETTPYPGFNLSLRRRNGTVASDELVGLIGTFINTSQNGVVRITDSDIRGTTTVVSTSLSNRKLFQNGQLLITDTKITTNQLPTIPAYIGCLNNQDSPFGYSNQRMQFTAIHEGLTDAEVVALHTIIDTFEIAIGRKTW